MSDIAITPVRGAMNRDEQHQHLIRVSRTFAFTIPFLPDPLADVVSNAYLLCRIADTVEDDPKADVSAKTRWLKAFAACAATGFRDPVRVLELSYEASALVKEGAVSAEYALMRDLDKVVARTRSYRRELVTIVCHGVEILAYGMAEQLDGMEIRSEQDVDRYCYAVAGVVGEMLAQLFAAMNHRIDKKALHTLAISFGEGLQLTNILKDRFADKADRNATFLPQAEDHEGRTQVQHYVALTRGHLDNAVAFILHIPCMDYGVRLFCLVNVIMAFLTLKRVARFPEGPGSALKISRRAVKVSAVLCMLCARFNLGVRALSFFAGLGLPAIRRDPEELLQRVSRW